MQHLRWTVFFVLAALALASCGDDELTVDEYVEQGNALCGAYVAGVEQLDDEYTTRTAAADGNQDAEDRIARDVNQRASELGDEFISDILTPSPPSSLSAEHQQLADSIDEVDGIEAAVVRGDLGVSDLAAAGEAIEEQLRDIWPGCRF